MATQSLLPPTCEKSLQACQEIEKMQIYDFSTMIVRILKHAKNVWNVPIFAIFAKRP